MIMGSRRNRLADIADSSHAVDILEVRRFRAEQALGRSPARRNWPSSRNGSQFELELGVSPTWRSPRPRRSNVALRAARGDIADRHLAEAKAARFTGRDRIEAWRGDHVLVVNRAISTRLLPED